MDNLMLFFSFFGNWLLFTFPLFQGCLEMKEQANTIDILTEQNSDYKKVSPWYWLLPLWKLSLEKKTCTDHHASCRTQSAANEANAALFRSSNRLVLRLLGRIIGRNRSDSCADRTIFPTSLCMGTGHCGCVCLSDQCF